MTSSIIADALGTTKSGVIAVVSWTLVYRLIALLYSLTGAGERCIGVIIKSLLM